MRLRRAGAFFLHGVMAGALVLGTSEQDLAALPSPTQRLGACAPEMVRAEELFPQAGGLRVVVARFVGQDEPSERMGADLAYTLSQELPEYTRKNLKDDAHAAGLNGDDVQVQYVPCLMASHMQAREVGRAWGADLVFWGQASCSQSDPLRCKLSPVVEKGARVTVQVRGEVSSAKGSVSIGVNDNRRVTVVVPPSSGTFKTAATLVGWRGLEGRSDNSVRVDPAAATELDFPRLASERPLALFHWAVGVYAFYSQRYALAAARFEEAATELYAGAEDRSNLYRIMGKSYLYTGKSKRGLDALEQALVNCQGGDVRCRCVALNNLGWGEDRVGDRGKALSYFEQALALHKQEGTRSGEAVTVSNLGNHYASMGEEAKALSYYEQALPLHQQMGDHRCEAGTLNGLGNHYASAGDNAKALSYYEQALSLDKQAGDRVGEAHTLHNLGRLFAALRDKDKALRYYEQALALHKQAGDILGEGATFSCIGVLYFNRGEQAKALDYYEQALTRAKQAGDRVGEAKMLNNIGSVYAALGEPAKAIGYHEQALLLLRQTGDLGEEGRTLNNIGRVYSALGKQAKALGYYEQALTLGQQARDRVGMARSFSNIGSVYFALGEPAKALAYCMQALARVRQAGHRVAEVDILKNIGRVYSALGEPAKALAYYEQSMTLQKRVGVQVIEGVDHSPR